MKTKNLFWAALSMTAALMMTACSNDDNDTTENPAVPSATNTSATKTIPYTVTVNDGATTRATVADDPSDATNYHKTLYFAAGDKLYITGTNIKGVLDLQAGDEGKASGATFSGDLTYTGGGSPADDLALTATLVSAQQTVGTQVSVDDAGAVTVNYPTTAYCTSVNDAVQKYSNLTGTSTYSAKSFTLTQQTAFLNFVITFEDGTVTGTALSAVVNNNSSDICTANVTTTTESTKVVAKFVLPVAAGTTLSSANVKMGDKEAISFGASQTLTGKVYNVKKTQAPATVPVTAITLNKTATTISAGQTETLSVSSVTPDDATDQTVTWSSDNEAVATVNATTGEVTAVAFGTANITATANDGSGVTATCAVTVTSATITVTINQSDWGVNYSFTKDGVTVSAAYIDRDEGNIQDGGTFSTTLGNFTKIVVTSYYCDAYGEGWSSSESSSTWAGTPASTVSFSGNFQGMGEALTTIVCTIQPTN